MPDRIRIFVTHLAQLTELRELVLTYCSLTDNVVQVLASSLPASLRILNLFRNSITNAGASALVPVNTLTHVNLEYNCLKPG